MSKQLKRVMAELQKESDKCVDINFRSVMLALHRFDGWGAKRMDKFAGELGRIFTQVAESDKSSVQMLDEEVGIELQNGEGKHWWDLPYLNISMWHDEPVSVEKLIYIRQQQKKWLKTSFMATVLLAMHRLYGWGRDRDLRLIGWMDEVECDCNYDPKILDQALADELGFRLVHKGKQNVGLVWVEDKEVK